MHEEDFGLLWKVGRPLLILGVRVSASDGVSAIPLDQLTRPHPIHIHTRQHVDYRTSHSEARRSRRLIISFLTTVVNYEYLNVSYTVDG